MDNPLIKHVELLTGVEQLYEKVKESLNEETLISLKPEIKRMANLCRAEKLFEIGKDKFNEFVEELDKHAPDRSKKLIVAWNILDERLSKAPNAILFIGSIILNLPILDHALDAFDEPTT